MSLPCAPIQPAQHPLTGGAAVGQRSGQDGNRSVLVALIRDVEHRLLDIGATRSAPPTFVASPELHSPLADVHRRPRVRRPDFDASWLVGDESPEVCRSQSPQHATIACTEQACVRGREPGRVALEVDPVADPSHALGQATDLAGRFADGEELARRDDASLAPKELSDGDGKHVPVLSGTATGVPRVGR